MSDGQAGSGRTDDPMSADRRVLTIAGASMVALVLVGVVSAQLFTGSACDAIDPRPHGDRLAGAELAEVLTEGLPDLDDAGRDAVVAGIATIAEEVGPVVGAADVGGAERLALVGGEVAALGPVTTVLHGETTRVRATRDLDEGTVVGDGDTLYSLALVNPLTGQVDAVQPLDADLEPGTCVDTATVGTPLAFHLDAGGGELLLLRTEEDGDEPHVELRDAEAGSVWSTPVEAGTAPAGVLAERVTGRLGEDLVVAGWRTTGDTEGPALVALDRTSGEIVWSLPASELRDQRVGGDEPMWVDVVAVDQGEVLVALASEEERSRRTLVAFDAADGALVWVGQQPLPDPTVASRTDDHWYVASGSQDDGLTVSGLGGEGELLDQGVADATGPARLAHVDGSSVAAAAGGPLVLMAERDTHVISTSARFLDAVAGDGHLHLLVGDEERAVVVTFVTAGWGG